MSTRSLIAYEEKDLRIISTYCHMDGYPSYNGAMLLHCWNSEDLARQLVDNGYISSLCPTIEEINDKRVHKDKPDQWSNEWSFIQNGDPLFMEYLYLFKGGLWWISKSMTLDTPDGYQDQTYYHSSFSPLTTKVNSSDIERLFAGEFDWTTGVAQ